MKVTPVVAGQVLAITLATVFIAENAPGADALKFVSEPVMDLELVQGKYIIVNCTVDDPNANVSLWENDGLYNDPWTESVPVPGEISKKGQVFVLMSASQNIKEHYKCKATNGNDTIEWSDDMGFMPYIHESIPVHVLVHPKEALIKAGQDINLTCSSEDAMNSKLQWSKRSPNNTNVYMPMSHTSILLKDFITDAIKAVLVIRNATVNDSAVYACHLTHGKSEKTEYVKLNVKDPQSPTIQRQNAQKTINVTEGSEKTLRCWATAFPAPSITWYKNGNKMDRPNCSHNGEEACKNNLYVIGKRTGTVVTYSTLKIKKSKFPRDQGEYTCAANNDYGSDKMTMNFDVQAPPKLKVEKYIFIKDQNTWTVVSCEVNRSNPWPVIQWKYQNLSTNCDATCKPNASRWADLPEEQRTSLPSGKTNRSVVYVPRDQPPAFYLCVATNTVGRDNRYILTMMQQGPEQGKHETVIKVTSMPLLGVIAVACSLVVLFAIAAFLAIYWRRRSTMREYFLSKGFDCEIDPDRSLLEQCNNLPYDTDWEFPERRLVMGEILGAGAFGQVVKAEAIGMIGFNPRDKTKEAMKFRSKLRRPKHIANFGKNYKEMRNSKTVAIKMLREGAKEKEYKDLASELKILIHIGPHRNIVNLLGACTRGKRLMVIMEFAPHGSLLSFLRASRGIYEAKWTKTSSDPTKEWTLADLVISAFQISKGLEFLVSKKCVHRDVAARNVLVGQEGDVIVMKIADFGLARDIYKDDLYVKKTSGLLPVKWMAPESLQDREYTEKTDIWSFGILLWEMFTLGGSPYPGLPAEQLLDFLTTKRKRLNQPRGCPLEVYNIMTDCWKHNAADRPCFPDVVERLGRIWRSNLEVNGNQLDGSTLRYVTEWEDRGSPVRLNSLAESGIGLEDHEDLLDIVISDAEYNGSDLEV